MAIPRPRLAPLKPWQVGWPRYVALWLGGGLAAAVSIWLLAAAVGQQDLPIAARLVVVVFAGFAALLTLGTLDALLTGGARAVTATTSTSGIDLTRAGETVHLPWGRIAAAGLNVRRTRFGDRGAALDLWLHGRPTSDLEALGEWVSESAPAQELKDRRLRIGSLAMPSLKLLSAEAPAVLGDRWFGRKK